MTQPTLQRDHQGVDYGEEQNVQELHAIDRREKRDGRVTIKPFSLWVLVVCGLVFFFAGFFSARNRGDFIAMNADRRDAPPAQSTLQVVQTANAPVVAHVAMKNMKFDPPLLEVKKGDTVEWKNADITPHTVTAGTFDSGSIASDGSWRHTFTEVGDFPYTCTFHPEMKATVVVK